MAKINVKNTDLTIIQYNDDDYICITDIARYKNAEHTDDVIKNWLRNRNTIELLGIWEYLHNPNFKPVEFDGFRKEAGLNSFVMTPTKWIKSTNAIGIVSQSGRYGGTYAHRDIAFPDLKNNIRDYATINELICLSNLENINAVLIKDKVPQSDRLVKLNRIAIHQMQILQDVESRKMLK